MMLTTIKNSILDILFPKFCLNCNREGQWLCEDCFSLIDIFEKQYCPSTTKLTNLYCATSYDNFIVKKLINQFKYKPYIKELSEPLSLLIITHLNKLENPPDFKEFILIPVPLRKNKLKQRGFNQACEIGQQLSKSLKIPVYDNLLSKIKQTPAQMELDKEQRIKNLAGAFKCEKPELVKNRKILLVDDIFTTGSTMRECAITLRNAGAQEIRGIAIARA